MAVYCRINGVVASVILGESAGRFAKVYRRDCVWISRDCGRKKRYPQEPARRCEYRSLRAQPRGVGGSSAGGCARCSGQKGSAPRFPPAVGCGADDRAKRDRGVRGEEEGLLVPNLLYRESF